MSIGENIKLALKRENMSVAELSRRTGISDQTIYSMIRRDSKKIRVEHLIAIAKAIPSLSVTELVALEDTSSVDNVPMLQAAISAEEAAVNNLFASKYMDLIRGFKRSDYETLSLFADFLRFRNAYYEVEKEEEKNGTLSGDNSEKV